jgi:hypothetical protein
MAFKPIVLVLSAGTRKGMKMDHVALTGITTGHHVPHTLVELVIFFWVSVALITYMLICRHRDH